MRNHVIVLTYDHIGQHEDLLISLWESAHFFSVLKNTEYKFFGTLHCEASLASLIDGTKTVSDELKVSYFLTWFIIQLSFLVKGLWTDYLEYQNFAAQLVNICLTS